MLSRYASTSPPFSNGISLITVFSLNLPFITWDCDDAGQCETSICVTAAETTRAVADLDLELQIAFQVTEGESASEVTTTVERLPDPEPE